MEARKARSDLKISPKDLTGSEKMKIKNLFIGNFGKLKDKNFDFSDRLNIIYGKNEAGKSTLSAYMKYMLYGFSSRQGRSVDSNDKTKYMPWDAEVMTGSAIVENGGDEFRIERKTGTKSTLKITDKNGKELLFGKEPGEEFFGLDEAAFSKMAYIRQNDISGDKMSNLPDIVQNAVYSADETVDIEKARKKLSDFRNVYRSKVGKRGKCYELDDKIRELRYDFDKASELHKTLLSAEAKLAETRAKIKSNEERAQLLEKELQNIDGFEAKGIIDKIVAAKTELENAGAELEKAKERITFDGNTVSAQKMQAILDVNSKVMRTKQELSRIEEAYKAVCDERKKISDKDPVLSKCPDEKVAGIDTYRKELAAADGKRFRCMIFAIVSAVMALLFGVGHFVLPSLGGGAFMLIMCAVFLCLAGVFGVLSFFGDKKLKKLLSELGFESTDEFNTFVTEYPAAKEKLSQITAKQEILEEELENKRVDLEKANDEFSELLSGLGRENAQDGSDVISEIKEAFEIYVEKENEYKRLESVFDTFLLTNDLHALSESANNCTHTPERDRKTVLREYEFFKKANENLSELEKQYIRQSAAPTSTVRKPSEILSERQATEALLEKATEKADAAELALESLEKACAELKGGISPRIAAKAGEFFSLFTDGKYDSLAVSGQFGLGVTDGGVIRDSGYLSQGTRDAAYLALRLSLCENLFKDKPPLVLDEVFAYVDDKRLEKILEVLVTLSEKYQIFLFTCHKREKDLLSNIEGVRVFEL